MRYTVTSIVLFLSFCFTLNAQQLDHRLGYLIIQVKSDVPLEPMLKEYSDFFGNEVRMDRELSRRLGIFTVAFDFATLHEGNLLDHFRSDDRIMVAQYDHLPKLRTLPDDPQFSSQWQWLNMGQTGGIMDADIDADLAWETTTGGVTPLGDTIVVAIVDDGLDYNHQDIAANAWINHHEIDGNGIDDDGNGYVDDIHGWNAYDESPDVWGQSHGLQVAGMIGAAGNNGIGVCGINWNVKLMMIVGGTPESAAIAAYAYALEMRRLYEETHGALGAFVVSTNSSWGIDFGQPADAPLWCSFYDELGASGILSAAATANLSIDIDVEGDLPTACPSEYLLSVTALNASNQRTFSAWGITQIDFGAPGADIFTTRRNNQYGNTSGTSFASPVAAGFVGLLYSAPCVKLAELSHKDPAAAALLVRDVIFNGVKKITDLESTIRLGGSLNAANSMNLLMEICGACPVPFAVRTDTVSDEIATVAWAMVDSADAVNARIRIIGDTAWDTLPDVTSPLQLTGLLACTTYEIEFEAICADTSTGYQTHFEFKTDGCCELPAQINTSVEGQTIKLDWSFVLAADYYVVQWRPLGEDSWIEDVAVGTSFSLSGLQSCQYYEIRLLTACDTSETDYSETFLLRTKGCGTCLDLEYCDSKGDDATEEYIDSLIIGPINNPSGLNTGYALFDNFNASFIAGDPYMVRLKPGFGTSGTFNEQFRIWIDTNQDGVFSAEEMVLDSVLLQGNDVLVSAILVDEDALAGSTRMRVSMAFTSPFFHTNQDPCDLLDFGEVEDYCIDILRHPDDCPEVDTVHFDGISFTSAFMYWPKADGAIAYTYRYREVGTLDYTELATVDTTASITGLDKCKTYEVQIRTVCPSDTTSYVKNYLLDTDCDVAVEQPTPVIAEWLLFPNPASDHVLIRMTPLTSGEYHIQLYSMDGRPGIRQKQYAFAGIETTVRLDDLANHQPGLYLVVLEKDGLRETRKLILL